LYVRLYSVVKSLRISARCGGLYADPPDAVDIGDLEVRDDFGRGFNIISLLCSVQLILQSLQAFFAKRFLSVCQPFFRLLA
jgi:hypothetical protein